MNKNNVITILVAATLLGSTWGAVVNRQKIDLEHQLALARAELTKAGSGRGGSAVLPAGASQEIAALKQKIKALGASCTDGDGKSQKPAAGAALSQQLEEAKAQLLGLEKIVEEKEAALQAGAQEKERLRINTEVLLAKIGDLQNELRASQEENRHLVKGLAAEKGGVGTPAPPSPGQP